MQACSPEHEKAKSLSAREFEEVLKNNVNIQIVDVRTRSEFAKGHIPDAYNIDVKQNGFNQAVESQLDKNYPIAVYCKSGVRSKVAAEILSDMGYTVYELAPGILEWKGVVSSN